MFAFVFVVLDFFFSMKIPADFHVICRMIWEGQEPKVYITRSFPLIEAELVVFQYILGNGSRLISNVGTDAFIGTHEIMLRIS